MITGLYASILALFFIYLAAQVIRLRLKHQVGIGDGNIPDLHVQVVIYQIYMFSWLLTRFTCLGGHIPDLHV